MTTSTTPRAARVRPEIQALRAFAVLAVVVYHLWPERLAGGFTGVDVFFVISGFLITAHLLREVAQSGRISLVEFWARRARRLLPAALVVIAASAVGVLLFVPTQYWEQFFREIGAAGLYVENWALASDSVDYLASDNVASPVQHYWSLSAEEQFYLAWPVLIMLALLVSRGRRAAIGATLALVVGASLAWSVVQTTSEPSIAYFSTFTRAWEFGAGGLLAYFAPAVAAGLVRTRTVVSLLGWIAIGAASLLYSGATAFPGVAAALPVVGTLAVIWAGSEKLVVSPTFVGRIRPVQFIGDISYSIYLWHWPIIIFVPFALAREVNGWLAVAVLALSVLLGWASKSLVEDPVRLGALARLRPRFTIGATALAMAVVVTVAMVGLSTLSRQADAEAAAATSIIENDTPCFGAAALAPDSTCDVAAAGAITPSIATAQKDFDAKSWSDCAAPAATAIECVFNESGETRVALIGDSHAHVWLPAIQDLAKTQNWQVHLFVKGGCSFSHATRDGRSADATANCVGWNESVDAALAEQEPYALVFTAQRAEINGKIVRSDGQSPQEAAVEGFRAAWTPLIERGATVVGIRDVRDTIPGVKDCVAANPDDVTACDAPEDVVLRHPDYLATAAATVSGARLVDLTRYFCVDGQCPAVIGGVLVNRDGDHITRTFARTLAPFLLAQAIAR
jgi:peptidoglycan/LPS O-acetylase OafA/YrhL